MPSNFTEHFNLSQWEPGDQVQRIDFNEDNRKIDAALADIVENGPHIYWGTYQGTREYGKDHPNSLTFPFPPKIMFVAERGSTSASSMMMAIRGQTYLCNMNAMGGGAHCTCTWEGNTLSWYNDSTANNQFNSGTYFYVALG